MTDLLTTWLFLKTLVSILSDIAKLDFFRTQLRRYKLYKLKVFSIKTSTNFVATFRELQLTRVGNGISFRKNSAEQTRIGFRYLRKKLLFPRHSEVYERVNSEARNRRKWNEKNQFYKKILLQQTEQTECFCLRHASERNSEHFSPLRNGSGQNSESFPFCGMVQNGIPRVCFLIFSIIGGFLRLPESCKRFYGFMRGIFIIIFFI